MSEPSNPAPDFETRLQREVDRVLMDPSFQRSPIQSRLLGYLCEQTIGHNRNISQIAVAVDGLGRPETADQLTESYPRVQISRLRRNLALYYARCAPGEGLAVYIRHGDYQLRLAPPDSAYGENRRRAAPQPPANDAAGPDDTTGREPPAPPPTRRRTLSLAALVLLGLAALGALWFAMREQADAAAGAPSLIVRIDGPAAGAADPLLVLAAQHADDIASSSYVVRGLRPEETAGTTGYTVRLQRSQTIGARPVLEVALFDPANQRLLHDSIPIGDDRAGLLVRLNGALLQMVSPAGAIAKRELAATAGEPRSDYECVLRTEADRLQALSAALAESCLKRFPHSPYRAYWFSRMAFVGYRDSVLSGGVVSASGEPWRNLQRALDADSGNPFANYLAAKVNIARGDCEAARPYTERALTNGSFYGVLTAASAAEAALCSGALSEHFEAERRVAALVEGQAEPNPLMYVSLIFATAAVDRPDLTRRLLASPPADDPQGSLAEVSAALQSGLADPAAFAGGRDRLQRVVDGFYWGDETRRKMMEKLEAVPARPA